MTPDELPRKAPVSLLLSYWYYRNADDVAATAEAIAAADAAGVTVRVLVDSGAFSAHTQGVDISCEDFAAWLDDVCVPAYGRWMTGVFNLDVIRDPDASWANWVRLRELGHDTMPVVHLGTPVTEVDRYVDAGCDYVGVGGLVGAPTPKRTGYSQRIHKYVRDTHPDVRLHGLGVSGTKLTRLLPWYSVDSTSMIVSLMYHLLRLYDPTHHRLRSEPMFDPDAPGRARHQVQFSQDFQRLLRHVYGVPPEVVMSSRSSNRQLFRELAGRVVEQFQEDARRRRPVPPPASLAADPPGTHVHGVYIPEDLIGMLRATHNPLTIPTEVPT